MRIRNTYWVLMFVFSYKIKMNEIWEKLGYILNTTTQKFYSPSESVSWNKILLGYNITFRSSIICKCGEILITLLVSWVSMHSLNVTPFVRTCVASLAFSIKMVFWTFLQLFTSKYISFFDVWINRKKPKLFSPLHRVHFRDFRFKISSNTLSVIVCKSYSSKLWSFGKLVMHLRPASVMKFDSAKKNEIIDMTLCTT